MIALDASHMPDPDEDEYDRRRLPGAYSQTIHHIRALRKERDALLLRGHAGDRFRAARLSWFIRNSENYAARLHARAAQLGVSGLGASESNAPRPIPLQLQTELFA